MDSRPIVNKGDKLMILIDTDSFNETISASNMNAIKLLKYCDEELFEFLRSDSETTHQELENITKLERICDGADLKSIKIIKEKCQSIHCFGYRMRDIEHIAEVVYNRSELSENEKESVLLVFIKAVVGDNKCSILVTENSTLLKKRLWFESHFPGKVLNIVNINEALELMDLFLKYRRKFLISSRYNCNKGYWYLLSTRTKLPFLHFSGKYLNALSNRFNHLLMSINEMGFQHFSGANNDTLDNLLYHFNYFIMLITGIFDNLALRTKEQYKLEFRYDYIPQNTSLSNQTGRDFKRAIRTVNLDLRNHITNFQEFINLIYQLRESIIHKEGLLKLIFTYKDGDEKWCGNFIKIDNDIFANIRHCRDREQSYDKVTEWGIHKFGNEIVLDPYTFSKSATNKLIDFINKYLGLLGFTNYIEGLNEDDKFKRTLNLFKKDHLGF